MKPMYTQQRFFTPVTFTFKQWSRAPYAVFRSLSRLIFISTLVLTYSLLTSDLSLAQTDTTSHFQRFNKLDEVIVSARRTPVAFQEAARLVTTLDTQALSRMPAQSITDALEYIPGLDLRQRGVHGVQADLSMRGGSFDQNLILLNGINMTDPQTGHHNLNLPVSMRSIRQVEILHGPAARIYGANAFSGAINFMTAPRNANQLNAFLTGGQHGFLHAGASSSIAAGKTRHFAAFSHKQSGNYTDQVPTDFKTYKGFYHGNIRMRDYRLELQMGHLNKAFAANTFYSPYYSNQYEETSTNFAAITGKWEKNWHVTHKFYWRRHYDHFVLKREDPDFYQNYHQTNTLGGSLNAWKTTRLGKTAFGMQYRNEHLLSNNLGKPMSQPRAVPFADDATYTKKANRRDVSFFAEQNTSWEGFHVSAGFLLNWNSMYPDKLRFYPGLDVSYRFSKMLHMYASLNRSLRLPTFTDLYYSGPNNIGNTDLQPEKSWTTETGLKYFAQGLQMKVAAFHRRGRNIIDWLWLQDKEKWHTRNLTRLNTTGTEVHLQLNPHKRWPGLHWLKKLNASYSFLYMTKLNEAIISNYALDHLKHKASLNIWHTVYKKLAATWYLGYFNREGTYLRYDATTENTREVPYGSHWQVDVRLMWTAPHWNAYLEATNLLDIRYYDTGSVPQPGRWIKAGIALSLDW